MKSGVKKNRRLVAGSIIVGLILIMALLSLLWTPYGIENMSGGRLAAPSWRHWLGTDTLGRDQFSRLMIGARVAVEVGMSSVLIGVLIGGTLGIVAGFARKKTDDALSSFLDILIAFPTLLLAMLIVAARGASLFSAILAIGLGISAVFARLTRLLTKSVLSKDFITASRISGTSWPRIIWLHILPNIWPTLLVTVALQFGIAGLAEASLSYLGLGAPPPNESWGSLLQQAQNTVYTAPLSAVIPGLLLITLVVGVNLLADGIRFQFDPNLGGQR
jgi:peptide/nickel transport system permease protein